MSARTVKAKGMGRIARGLALAMVFALPVFATSSSGPAPAFQLTGRNGKVAFVGFGETQPMLSPAMFIEKQLSLIGSFVFPIDRYEEILGFVRKHEVPIEATITHTVALDDAPEVFPAFDRGETGKVVFAWPAA